MAELIVHNPPRAALKASGYIGSPEGDIELTENDKTYNVADFATATTRIPKPPEPTGTKEIIENGVHDVKEYAFADVKIPEPSGTIVLDENNRSYDVTDYAAADVAIPEEEKTVMPSTTRQEVTPDNGLLSKVTVLPAPLEERTVTPTIVQQTITPEAPAIGLSKVTVGATLPPPILVSKQITENGTYTAADDNADGYSEVTVEVPDESKDILNSLIDRSITTITSDATSIGDYAFYNCRALTEVNVPNATSIGAHAFHSCVGLTEVNFPLVTSIGADAFNSCMTLTEANFPNVTSIGFQSFYNCRALTEANFPNVTSIGFNSFYNCRALTEVNVPNATSIEGYAFRSCVGLTEVNFPLVTSIGSQAFNGCSSIKHFDMSDVKSIPTIMSDSFINTNFPFLFKDQTQLDEYANATNWSALADRFQIKGATT